MGWKQIGKYRYYYHSRREGGRVVSDYVGRGQVAEVFAFVIEADREERHVHRAELAEVQERLRQEEQELADWFNTIEWVAVATMLAAGYHHHRGQWRRIRMPEVSTPQKPTQSAPSARDELSTMLEQASKGDMACLPKLREQIQAEVDGRRPGLLLSYYGNPPEWVRAQLIESSSGSSLSIEEGLKARLKQLRKELEGPNPTSLERLLVERVVNCWLILYTHENQYATAEGLSIAQAEFRLRQVDTAHRRFLSAVKTLAQVRKLALPVLQLNIGANQVNVASADR